MKSGCARVAARLGALLAALGGAGCDLAPPYTPPAVATPAAYKEVGDWKLAAPRDDAPRGAWWRVFGDPVLDGLEDKVTGANQDLKVALARFDEARADARGAQADYYPTIDASSSATRASLSGQVRESVAAKHGQQLRLGP